MKHQIPPCRQVGSHPFRKQGHSAAADLWMSVGTAWRWHIPKQLWRISAQLRPNLLRQWPTLGRIKATSGQPWSMSLHTGRTRANSMTFGAISTNLGSTPPGFGQMRPGFDARAVLFRCFLGPRPGAVKQQPSVPPIDTRPTPSQKTEPRRT